jgi:dienelactone hydrolase
MSALPPRFRFTLTVLAVALAIAVPTPATAQRSPVASITSIPLPISGTTAASSMRTMVFKPTGIGPFKVLLYAHGRPAYASQRAQLVHPVSYGHVRYWLAKGYAVVAPIRPGYGAAGGADTESSGAAYSASGQCLHRPNPAHTAQAAAQAQRAALDWVRQQPWARANHIVLEGQSVGGLATVALCAAQPPGVVGCINFSGGAGGDPQHAPGHMCAPEQTTQLMREYGGSTQVPSIWLYAQNDMYWGSEPPLQWHTAFAQAASATAHHPSSTFVQTPPVGSDGHSLLRAGTKHWGPPLEAWIRQHGL